MDDRCIHLPDEQDYIASDYSFDYSVIRNRFKLRRPVPCPAGMYCHPGTGVDVSNMKNYTTPQPCFESMYCPEGSADPTGSGECPAGFYCPFGEKISCPVAHTVQEMDIGILCLAHLEHFRTSFNDQMYCMSSWFHLSWFWSIGTCNLSSRLCLLEATIEIT